MTNIVDKYFGEMLFYTQCVSPTIKLINFDDVLFNLRWNIFLSFSERLKGLWGFLRSVGMTSISFLWCAWVRNKSPTNSLLFSFVEGDSEQVKIEVQLPKYTFCELFVLLLLVYIIFPSSNSWFFLCVGYTLVEWVRSGMIYWLLRRRG